MREELRFRDAVGLVVAEYQEVLTSQQALLNARRALVQQKANCTLHAIALYKALGGGIDERDDR